MSRYPIGVYEKALYVRPLEKMIEDAAQMGFHMFEISIDESDLRISRLEWSGQQRSFIRNFSKKAGIPLYSMCFSAQRRYAMGSSDKRIEKKSMQMMRKAIELAVDLDIRVIQVAGYDVYYESHTEDTAKRFEENLMRSVEMASDAGVMLSVETVEKYVTSVEKAVNIVQRIRSPWLNIYPDTANLYMSGFDVTDELQKGEGYITTIHMREAPDDRYIPFGKGKLDFNSIFEMLKKIEYRGPLMIELWNEKRTDYKNVLSESMNFLKKKMKEH